MYKNVQVWGIIDQSKHESYINPIKEKIKWE